MKRAYLLAALAAATLTVAACGGSEPEKPAAPAAAAAPPPPPPAPPAPPVVPGLSQPYATEAEWMTACKGTTPPVPESVCTCVSKAAVKELGPDAFYDWSYKWLVNQEAMERMRAERFFKEKGIDKDKEKALIAATNKCYTH